MDPRREALRDKTLAEATGKNGLTQRERSEIKSTVTGNGLQRRSQRWLLPRFMLVHLPLPG